MKREKKEPNVLIQKVKQYDTVYFLIQRPCTWSAYPSRTEFKANFGVNHFKVHHVILIKLYSTKF